MDKRDFDFDFDFEKEYGIDPDSLGDQEFDDMDFDDDQLGFDLNDPIFDEDPAPAPAAPQVPQEEPMVDDMPMDDEPADDIPMFDPEPEYVPEEPVFAEEVPAEEPGFADSGNEAAEESFPAEEEAEPQTSLPPMSRQEARRLQRQKARDFKENKLPKIIAAVAAGLILFFVAGSIIRAVVNGIEDKRNEENAQANQQSAAQLLQQESQRLLAEAADLAAGYDYESAIAALDSFSGELTDFPEMVSRRSEYAQLSSQVTAWSDPSKVPNLAFHVLIADPGRAFTDQTYGKKYNQNFVTIDEFSKILQQLYDKGYVLVSMDDVYTATTSADGVTTFAANTIYLPHGKKPVMITETLVNYLSYMIDSNGDGAADQGGDGFASRLVLDASGNVKAELVTSTGDTVVGDYDLVPILNTFIKEHPDFSYRGARALLAVCGYEGIFGYRINESVIADKGQDYYNTQVAEAKKLVAALRDEGYDIACYTYENIPYGNANNATRIKEDLTRWSEEIAPVLGNVDILVYAQNSEIESYNSSKYNVLYSSGFRFFVNSANAPWSEITTNYVRQSRLMVTGTNMAYHPELFTNYFNAMAVLNSARGTVPN